MSRGAAVIRTTPWAVLFGRAGARQRLFFRPSGAVARDDIEIMNPEQRKIAFRCSGCEAIFILPAPTGYEYA
jgi:hypothetical protein